MSKEKQEIRLIKTFYVAKDSNNDNYMTIEKDVYLPGVGTPKEYSKTMYKFDDPNYEEIEVFREIKEDPRVNKFITIKDPYTSFPNPSIGDEIKIDGIVDWVEWIASIQKLSDCFYDSTEEFRYSKARYLEQVESRFHSENLSYNLSCFDRVLDLVKDRLSTVDEENSIFFYHIYSHYLDDDGFNKELVIDFYYDTENGIQIERQDLARIVIITNENMNYYKLRDPYDYETKGFVCKYEHDVSDDECYLNALSFYIKEIEGETILDLHHVHQQHWRKITSSNMMQKIYKNPSRKPIYDHSDLSNVKNIKFTVETISNTDIEKGTFQLKDTKELMLNIDTYMIYDFKPNLDNITVTIGWESTDHVHDDYMNWLIIRTKDRVIDTITLSISPKLYERFQSRLGIVCYYQKDKCDIKFHISAPGFAITQDFINTSSSNIYKSDISTIKLLIRELRDNLKLAIKEYERYIYPTIHEGRIDGLYAVDIIFMLIEFEDHHMVKRFL